MNSATPPYELFEAYLDGGLEATDKAAFEQRLQAEPELQEQFELYRNLQADYRLMETTRGQEAAVTATLTGLNRQYFGGQDAKKGKVVSMRRSLYMLAAAASLLAAFFLLKPLLFTAADGDLFNKYYEERELNVSRSNTDSPSLSATLFNDQKYTEALAILEPYTNAHPDATDLLMARGACYLQTGAYSRADAVFAPIAAGATVYAPRAQWMLAIVQLKQDKKEETKKLLQAIDVSSEYYKQAQELLKKL